MLLVLLLAHLADLQLLGCRRIVHVNRRSAANAQQHDKVSCLAAVHATTPQTGTHILSSGAHVYPMYDDACVAHVFTHA